jgi:hypothetical protein
MDIKNSWWRKPVRRSYWTTASPGQTLLRENDNSSWAPEDHQLLNKNTTAPGQQQLLNKNSS